MIGATANALSARQTKSKQVLDSEHVRDDTKTCCLAPAKFTTPPSASHTGWIVDESRPQDGALTIESGLDRMREMVVKSSSPIRLVGLSGVGKTRLIQALFDARVGNNPLPEQQVLYCDFGQPVNPSPNEVARQLVARRDRVILIVDNCSPEIHRALAAITAPADANVSLITVEYDVRDDDMEGTEVFRLEPGEPTGPGATCGSPTEP